MKALYLMKAFLELGPRELGGALDLISQYKLWPHHEFFCKRLPPLSSLQTCYLHNVVGNTEIKKGEGMELDQLVRTKTNCKEKCTHFSTFELDTLSEAFQMRDSTPIDLPSVRYLLIPYYFIFCTLHLFWLLFLVVDMMWLCSEVTNCECIVILRLLCYYFIVVSTG